MTMFADFTRIERASYFRDHGQALLTGRADLVAALEHWFAIVKKCGAYERPGFTVEKATADALDSLDAPLAEEVRDWLIG